MIELIFQKNERFPGSRNIGGNRKENAVLSHQKEELHRKDSFGDTGSCSEKCTFDTEMKCEKTYQVLSVEKTGLYMEKDPHNIEMRRENIREKMRKGKMALEICVCGKEAA